MGEQCGQTSGRGADGGCTKLTSGNQVEGYCSSGEGLSGLGLAEDGCVILWRGKGEAWGWVQCKVEETWRQERVKRMPGMSYGPLESSTIQSARQRPLCGSVWTAFWPHLVFQCLLAAGLFLYTDCHMETHRVNQEELERAAPAEGDSEGGEACSHPCFHPWDSAICYFSLLHLWHDQRTPRFPKTNLCNLVFDIPEYTPSTVDNGSVHWNSSTV